VACITLTKRTRFKIHRREITSICHDLQFIIAIIKNFTHRPIIRMVKLERDSTPSNVT
jgi:hypothetical protein